MKQVLFTVITIALLFSSCAKYSENINEAMIKKTKVNFEISTTELSSANKSSERARVGTFKRYDAPVYISGVDITAKYLELTTDDITNGFDFVDGNDGEDISIMIALGSNKFDAVTRTSSIASSIVYPNSIDMTEDADKATDYAKKLIAIQPIYAVYTGSTSQIITTGKKDVLIAMKTLNTRFSVVVEPYAKYNVVLKVSYDKGSKEVKATDSTKASAIVLNDESLKAGDEVFISLDIYSKTTDEKLKTIIIENNTADKKFIAKGSLNNTIALSFNSNGDLIMQKTGISFSWTVMGEEGTSIVL